MSGVVSLSWRARVARARAAGDRIDAEMSERLKAFEESKDRALRASGRAEVAAVSLMRAHDTLAAVVASRRH